MSVGHQAAATSYIRAPSDLNNDHDTDDSRIIASEPGENCEAMSAGNDYSHLRRYPGDTPAPMKGDDIYDDVGQPIVCSPATPASLEHGSDVLQASGGACGGVSSEPLGRDLGQLYLDEFFDSSDYELLNPKMDRE